MNLLPFMLLGLLNGSLVGLMAVLFLRTLSPGTDWLRIRDAGVLGMIGSLAGNGVATLVASQDGYFTGGPTSLLFAVVSATLAVGSVAFFQLSHRPQRERSCSSSQG